MQSTPRGRQTMQWLVDNYVYVDIDSSEDGAFWTGRKIVLGDGYENNAPTLVHEANHARYSREGRSATARLSRDDYIDASIEEETDGTVQAIQAAKEFRAAGHNLPDRPGEPEYDNAYQNAKTNGASDAEAEQAGYDAIEQKFYDGGPGGFITSTNSKTYPEHYGEDWDSRPCIFGLLFC